MYDKQSPFSVTKVPGRRDSLSDSAYATLRAAIIDCRISPGRAVSEAELSARFAFGLAAVRAAVIRLTASGWIAPDGQRGSVILPVSAAHLADLTVSRQCLEPALLHHVPPLDLGKELRLHAAVHHAATAQGIGPNQHALLHQERALLVLIAQAVAAPRIRGWLIDTWELCLRADFHLEQCFGISREPLSLPELAVAVAEGDAPATTALLKQMRHAFDHRVSRALARSATPLSAPPEPLKSQGRSKATPAAPRSEASPRPRSTKGDPA
ncbi:GntR family transcriptional regulator [Paracoccus liaowanqingii]|uniref:GntR family transcriptional regulator n=1 Tax=Paracoccus liaowanqingii TaxID=2560053 RepID=A0A4Z1C9X4_9RHOB|nr:GntR family transcriptional regulator [Paracoccus liaowanqingii]TGN57870.1 GntR family transcriptional regulator [Paracoccus liaowanqingii]